MLCLYCIYSAHVPESNAVRCHWPLPCLWPTSNLSPAVIQGGLRSGRFFAQSCQAKCTAGAASRRAFPVGANNFPSYKSATCSGRTMVSKIILNVTSRNDATNVETPQVAGGADPGGRGGGDTH